MTPLSALGTVVLRLEPAPKNLAADLVSPIVAESPTRRGSTPAIFDNLSIKQKVCPPRSDRKKNGARQLPHILNHGTN